MDRPWPEASIACNGAMCNLQWHGINKYFLNIELGGVGTWPHLHPIGAPQGPPPGAVLGVQGYAIWPIAFSFHAAGRDSGYAAARWTHLAMVTQLATSLRLTGHP